MNEQVKTEESQRSNRKQEQHQENKQKKEHKDKDKPIVIKPGKSHAEVSDKNE